jgi:hypothetical protein
VIVNSLSMYSITENIYYSQLSSVSILLQPEPVPHRIKQGKVWDLSPRLLSPCGLPLPPTCLFVTVNEARSYFASTIVSQKLTTALMMEAVSTSETPVNFYKTTRCNIPDDSHLHTSRRDNLKSHDLFLGCK